MTKQMKVYGGNWCGLARRVVAAPSKKRAAELLGVSLPEFNKTFSETANRAEWQLTLVNPEIVYTQPYDSPHAPFIAVPVRRPDKTSGEQHKGGGAHLEQKRVTRTLPKAEMKAGYYQGESRFFNLAYWDAPRECFVALNHTCGNWKVERLAHIEDEPDGQEAAFRPYRKIEDLSS